MIAKCLGTTIMLMIVLVDNVIAVVFLSFFLIGMH